MTTTQELFLVWLIGAVLCFISWYFYFKSVNKEFNKRKKIFTLASSCFSFGGLLWSFVYWFLALADEKNTWTNDFFD